MSFIIASAFAQDSTQGAPAGNPFLSVIMFAGLFIFMYFFLIRPQQKRHKEHENLVNSLSKNDEIVTDSGLLGKIVKVDDNYMVIEVGEKQQDKIELKFQKSSVRAVLPKGTIKQI